MLSLKEIHTQIHISNLFTSCGLCAITAIICTRNLHLFYFLIFYVIFPFSMDFMCLFSDLYIYFSFFSPPLHFLYLFISCLLYYSPGHISQHIYLHTTQHFSYIISTFSFIHSVRFSFFYFVGMLLSSNVHFIGLLPFYWFIALFYS